MTTLLSAQIAVKSCTTTSSGGASSLTYTFPETSGTNLNSSFWAAIVGGAKGNGSNQAYGVLSAENILRYIGTEVSWTANQWAQITFAAYTSGTTRRGVLLRAQTDNSQNYYTAYCIVSTCQVNKVVAGTGTQIGSSWTYTSAVGDQLKWTVTGTGASTTFAFYANGVHQGTDRVDSTGAFSTGTPGIYIYNNLTTHTISNFQAGNN